MEAPWADALSGAADPAEERDEDGRAALARTLAEGVRRGVITRAQRARLIALAADGAAAGAPGEVPNDALAAPDALEPRDAPARHRLSAVAVAYWLGGALVVFALGWFLADRWERLGPAGVLAVVSAYAAAFALASWPLAAAGRRHAAGAALGLVVATVPAAAWSLLRLTGEWPAGAWDDPLVRHAPYMATRRLVVSLATVLAVLVSLRATSPRRVRRVALAVPLAVASAFALVDAGVALIPWDLTWVLRPWTMLVAGGALFAVAHAVDRATARVAARDRAPEEDFAAWLYPASAVVLHLGLVDAWSQLGGGRHALPVLGAALLGAALALGRRTLLLVGALDVVWYLGWLAFDVFRDVVSFPFVLAGFGAAVIALTVLVQRRFPALLRRAGAARGRGELPRLPGGWVTVCAPLALALALLAAQLPGARARVEAREREAARAARVRPAPPPARESAPSERVARP